MPHTDSSVFFKSLVAGAATTFDALAEPQKLALVDEIYAQQPNLLASVTALSRFGAHLEDIDIALKVLCVTWLAMKASGLTWPLIREDVQDQCMQSLTAKIRFAQGLPSNLVGSAVQQHVDQHQEPWLLAYAQSCLEQSGLVDLADEAKKWVALCIYNLVEVVASTAPGNRSQGLLEPRRGIQNARHDHP